MAGPKDAYYRAHVPGRPRKMTEWDMRQATRALESEFASDAADLQRKLFPRVGYSTVKRYLVKAGYHGFIRRKKPYLKPIHIKKRKQWERMHRHWPLQQWQKVIFSDESKYCLFGSDGRVYCQRKIGRAYDAWNVKKTVKHEGGSIMVWGCISWKGVGQLHRVDGTMNADQYCQSLEESYNGTGR